MFGKRKNEAETGTRPGPADPRNQGGAKGRTSSRPDASAVLDRQPVPPVRRPAEQSGGAERRGAEQAEAREGNVTEMKNAEGEGKKLIVGRGIKLSGEINACEKLVVEGEVEADLSGAQVLEISEHGLFRGRAMVDYAEISGTFEGELTVRDRLLLHSSGQIDGELHYAEIEVERGGRIRGKVSEGEEKSSKANATATAKTSGSEAPSGSKPAAAAADSSDAGKNEKATAAS